MLVRLAAVGICQSEMSRAVRRTQFSNILSKLVTPALSCQPFRPSRLVMLGLLANMYEKSVTLPTRLFQFSRPPMMAKLLPSNRWLRLVALLGFQLPMPSMRARFVSFWNTP